MYSSAFMKLYLYLSSSFIAATGAVQCNHFFLGVFNISK